MASNALGYEERNAFSRLMDFLKTEVKGGKILVLFGLRCTGKTTMTMQAILSMNKEERRKTAYIEVPRGVSMQLLSSSLCYLMEKGFRNVFIEEATNIEDFVMSAIILSTRFAKNGMKIVLSGTDSLGF